MRSFGKFLGVVVLALVSGLTLPLICKAREVPHVNIAPSEPKYVIDEKVRERLKNDFSYHPPHGDQVQRYGEIRDKIHETAIFLAERCPPSRELSLAFTALETASMEANAAIARNERPPQLG